MAEIRMHADGLTRACVQVTEEQPVPHLVIVCGDARIEFTPGHNVGGLGDVTLTTMTGATVIARAAAEWRDRLAKLGQAASVVSERFPSRPRGCRPRGCQ